MFVCGKCHDTDKNAIGCAYTIAGHLSMGGGLRGICDVCNKEAYVVFCNKYSLLTKQNHTKRSCELCAFRTECTKFYHAFGTYESKARDCMTYMPEGKYKEQTNGKYPNR